MAVSNPCDLVIQLTPSHAKAFSRDRQLGHQTVMSMLPDGIGPRARATTQTLWHVDACSNTFTLRSLASLEPANIGHVIRVEPMANPPAGAPVEIRMDLSCTKTPPSDVPKDLRAALKSGKAYRSKSVIVPENERESWARTRLERIGLAVQRLELSALGRASLGNRGGAIPYVSLIAHVTVVDQALLRPVLAAGLGKGRNFGLGLVRFSSPQKG